MRDFCGGIWVINCLVNKASSLFDTICCYLAITLFFIIPSSPVFAEGSKELITNGGQRAYLYSSTITSVNNPFPTLGIIKVYAKVGETIYMGSSAQGIGNGTIIAKTPNGLTYNSGSGIIGKIDNVSEEIAGPLPNSDGYDPYTRTVAAGEEGVWEISFISPNATAGPNSNIPPKINATASWSQANNTSYISAFDVSVRATENVFLTGRTYTNVFGGSLTTYDALFYARFKVLTKDGYIYDVDNNGQAGYTFVFFVNNKGFRNGSNDASYKSINTTTNPPVHDPRTADTGSDITHKIFFNEPNSDLPASASIAGGGTTWLLNPLSSPKVSNFLFTGIEGNLYKGGTFPLGGNITFEASHAMDYFINLDINKNGSFLDGVDGNFSGTAVVGSNTRYWNGLDGLGNPMAGNLNFSPSHMKISLKGGEIHFPFMDVENNVNGIIIRRTNGVGSPNDIVYWDDTNISGGKVNLAGSSSTTNGHKWGSTSYSATTSGNEVGLDTWTYVESASVSPIMNVSLSEADLEVVSITSNKTSYCVGEEITYTVQLRNNGPDNVTGAKFAFNYPNGFSFLSVTSVQTLGVSTIYNNASNNTQFTATVDMAYDAVLSLTIKGKTNTAGALAPNATIMRPADVNDPDATNPNTAVPTDPLDECNSGVAGCNNIKTASSVTINTRSITIGNAPKILEGTGVVRNVVFPVSISAVASCDITVDYTVSHVTTNSADFGGAVDFKGTITIPAGSTSVNLQFLLNTENIIEGNETFTVNISNPVGGTLNNLSATGTIDNDDFGAITVTKTNGAETGPVPGSFIFSFPSGVTSDVDTEIDYTLAGTSAASTDYSHAIASTGTIIIPAGQNSITLSLPVIDDAIVEGDETVTIALTRLFNSHSGTVTNNSPVTPVVTISDNDFGTLNLSSDVTINEGNSGTTTATFTLTLDKATGSFFTLNYNTSNGTALSADNDYTASGSIQLNFNGTSAEIKTITIPIIGDSRIEATEMFNLVLSNLSDSFGGRLSIPVSTRTVTITNDDAGVINIAGTSGEEGVQNASFVFSYPPGLTTDIATTVNYTLTGTATGVGTDYTGSLTGTVIIPAGRNSVTLTLPVTDDTITEGTEKITITAAAEANAYGIAVSNSPQTINILDNDTSLLTMGPVTVTEGQTGVTTASFTLTLDKATSGSFIVGYTTSDVTASTADGDYIAPSAGSAFSFNGTAGEIQTINISIKGDRKIEPAELFNVILSPPSNTFTNRLSLQTTTVSGTINNDDSGIVSITKTDGAETGPASGSFIFSLPAGYSSDQPTTINYTLTGTAGASGSDYTASAINSIIIPAGQNSVTLNLTVIDDSIVEGDETVSLSGVSIGSSYSGITLNPVIPSITITDNDNATLTLSTFVMVTEGNTGTTTATFTLILDKATTSGFTVNFATADGTALVADNDYVSGSGLLTFTGTAGESRTISVTINSDNRVEPDETLGLIINGLSNNFSTRLTIPVSTSGGTIKNDDAALISITKSDGSEGSFDGSFTFSYPAGVESDLPTTINYTLTGTATGEGTDYSGSLSGTVTIPAGQNSITLSLPVADDAITEDTETVTLTTGTVGSPYGFTVANSPQTLNIFDDDNAVLTISSPVTLAEGNAGAVIATFFVTLNRATQSSFTINYATSDGDATTSNSDYTSSSGTLNFAGNAGEVHSISVAINGDLAIEADETFNISLSSLSTNFNNRLLVESATAVGRITNDDGGDITISTSNGAEEGKVPGVFTFSFPAGFTSDQPTIINYTLGGTALSGSDYTGVTSGTVTIPAFVNSVALTLPVIDDEVVEGSETITITIGTVSNPYVFTVANTFQSINIADNDNAILKLSKPVEVTETHSGTVNAVFTVTLDNATSTGFTVNYSAANGTALVGDKDFLPNSGSLSFVGTAGEIKTITVQVNGDTKIETDETFIVNLSSLNNTFNNRLTVPVTSSTGTIKNDDSGTITITKADGAEGIQSGRFIFSFPAGVSADVPTTINYSLSGTATGAGTDYSSAISGTVTIGISQNSVTLNLPVIDDMILEEAETVTLTAGRVTSPYGISISDSPQTISILDNDNAVLTFSPLAISEGDTGTSTAIFTVTLNRATGQAFTLDYTTANGTATTADTDYIAKIGTLSFSGIAGETQSINIEINGDRKIENDETFSLLLSGLSNNFTNRLIIPVSTVTGTITNDDSGVISITASNGSETGLIPGTFVFAFPAGYSTDQPTTINYTLGGTAVNGGLDYTGATFGSIIIPAGENSVTLNLPVIDDLVLEDNETIIMTAGTVTSIYGLAVCECQPTILITDNDNATLTLSAPVVINEGNSGTSDVVFTVTLDKATSSSFTVGFMTTDGTAAITDNDYIGVNGNLSFSGTAGESKTITIKVNGDTKIEAAELFNLLIGNLNKDFGGRLNIPEKSRTATIANDDSGAILITKTDGREGVQGGSITFSFLPELTTDLPVVINYTLGGTASAGGIDYTGTTPGSITLPAGQNSVTLNFPVIDDVIIEDTEAIELAASAVSNAYGISVSNPAENINIFDNDVAELTISTATITEGNAGTQLLNFIVTLNKATRSGFTVGYSTSDGSATLADGDYKAAAPNSALSFNGTVGETQNISITINGDRKIEANETFEVTLSNLSTSFNNRLTLKSTIATGTINNDDSAIITVTKADGSETGPVAGRFIFSFQPGVISDSPTTINYTLGGSAGGNGLDYTETTTGSVIIPAGQNSTTLNLSVIDDEIIEDSEVISNEITSINSVYLNSITIDNTTPVISITDNDFADLTLSGPIAVPEGNAGTSAFNFTVTLNKQTGSPFTVNYFTSDGTATTADNDYIPSGVVSLSFAGTANESKIITIQVKGDLKIEADELFSLALNTVSNTFGNRLRVQGSPVSGKIKNDDAGELIITKIDGTEGFQDGSFIFSFPQGISSDAPTIINYKLGGTATSTDYTPSVINSVTIPAGANSATLVLPVIDDDVLEDPESVILTILNVNNIYNNVTWSVRVPEVTVFDNDNAVLTLSSPVAVFEKNSGTTAVTFTLQLDKLLNKGFEIFYSTKNATATEADKDYESKSGRLSFAGFAGEKKEINLLINGDTKIESDELYNLVLDGLNPAFAGRLVINGNPGTVTILNDDIAPVAQPDMVSTMEDTQVIFSLVDNDTDVDGIDPKTITLTSMPGKGKLKANIDGTVTYTPALNDFGTHRFTYTVKDIFGLVSNEATVKINITPVNDAPVAVDDVLYVSKNVSFRETVRTNDSDPDSDDLRFKLLSSPSKGQLQFFNPADGSFIYTPQKDFVGVDGFKYEINDPAGLKDQADVTLNIQPHVIARLSPLINTIAEGDTISVSAVINEPLLQDVTLTLSYTGSAENNKDYILERNYQTITIPSGATSTTEKVHINTLKDYLKEGEEKIVLQISSVTPSAFVSIGSGSEIIINDFYPEEKAVSSNENADINPDPLTSPNGDGLGNEKFVIHNIEKYPDNEVVIFNRWGSEVYRIQGYNNSDKSFAGVANKGLLSNGNSTLVDGVYYFLIYTKAGGGEKRMNKGYVIIKR